MPFLSAHTVTDSGQIVTVQCYCVTVVFLQRSRVVTPRYWSCTRPTHMSGPPTCSRSWNLPGNFGKYRSCCTNSAQPTTSTDTTMIVFWTVDVSCCWSQESFWTCSATSSCRGPSTDSFPLRTEWWRCSAVWQRRMQWGRALRTGRAGGKSPPRMSLTSMSRPFWRLSLRVCKALKPCADFC